MRVTTPMLYDAGTRGILERQADLLRTQNQLSSGRRVLAPSDDPVAATQALGVLQNRGVNAQFAANVVTARNALSFAEGAVSDLQDCMSGVRELLLQAGNGSLNDGDRRSVAADLRSRLGELLEIANRRDGSGRALFAGYLEDGVPFSDGGAAVTYAGDQGTRAVQISASRSVAVTASGAALFESIPVGNGAFQTAAAAGNTGDASITSGNVTDPALLTGHDYEVVFTVLGATTTYHVVDTTLGVTISTGNPYTSGAAIGFDGQQVKVSASPANGDRFTLAPAARQNLFATVKDAIALLETPLATAPARGALATGIDRALASLDQAAERALAVRTQFGANLRELDAMEAVQSGLALEYDRELSQLQDLDYAQAVSDFTRQQQALEAAQKAFRGTTQLSLFALL